MYTKEQAKEIVGALKDVDAKLTFLEALLYFRGGLNQLISDLKHDHRLSNMTHSDYSDLANDIEKRAKSLEERIAKL